MPYTVIARYRAAEGNADRVARLLGRLAAASRAEPDNLSYEVARDLEDGARFIIVESYRSEAGFDTHRETVHFTEIGKGEIIPLLAERTVQAFS
jgi:quinol monooxygenase YgiN